MPEHTSGHLDPERFDDGALGRLSSEARATLATFGRSIEFDTDAVILDEGADTRFLGLLEEGRVALRLRVPERGHRLTILTVEPGELLGWSAVVAPYRATVDAIAVAPTRIVAFDAAELRRSMARDATLAAELPPLVLETVAHRLTSSWTQLLDLFGTQDAQSW